MNKLGKLGQLTILNMATAGIGFITFFVLVRSLPIDVFGEWVLYLTAFNLAEMLKTGFVRQAFIQHHASQKGSYQKTRLAGSSLALTIAVSLALALLAFAVHASYSFEENTGIGYFFLLYPIISVLGLPTSFCTWLAQAQEKANRMAILGLVPAMLLMLFAIVSLFGTINLLHIIMAHVTIRLAISLYLTFRDRHLKTAFKNLNTHYIKSLWDFGKYSTTTLLGTNLLKSSDNFLIGYFLGPSAVGIYNIPLKLLEVAEIPARSAGQIMLSSLSKLHSLGRISDFKNTLNSAILKLQKLYLPLGFLAFLFAHQIVEFIAGSPQMEAVWVLRIFLIYTILVPMDRLIGVAIDSTGSPKFNSMKVWGMVVLNILGDVLVLNLFGGLWMVAMVTIINALSGILIGKYLMNKTLRGIEYPNTLKQTTHVQLA